MGKSISMENVIGQKITEIRSLTDEEAIEQHWDVDDNPLVIVLKNGVKLYICNEDMSGPGTLWGFGMGQPFVVAV